MSDEEHPETYCHRCGGPNITWTAPSPLWSQVMRGGDINGDWQYDEIICPICFVQLAEAAGIASLWRLSAERVNVELQTTTPTGRIWDAEAWLWRDPPTKPVLLDVSRDPQRHPRDETGRFVQGGEG